MFTNINRCNTLNAKNIFDIFNVIFNFVFFILKMLNRWMGGQLFQANKAREAWIEEDQPRKITLDALEGLFWEIQVGKN